MSPAFNTADVNQWQLRYVDLIPLEIVFYRYRGVTVAADTATDILPCLFLPRVCPTIAVIPASYRGPSYRVILCRIQMALQVYMFRFSLKYRLPT